MGMKPRPKTKLDKKTIDKALKGAAAVAREVGEQLKGIDVIPESVRGMDITVIYEPSGPWPRIIGAEVGVATVLTPRHHGRWEVPIPNQPRTDFRAVNTCVWEAIASAICMALGRPNPCYICKERGAESEDEHHRPIHERCNGGISHGHEAKTSEAQV